MNVKIMSAVGLFLICAFAQAGKGKIEFKDPTGDDNGPGGYIYPTDAVYTKGSFDLTAVELSYNDKKMDVEVSLDAKLDDPWGMGGGFAVQMVFVFIDTKAGGHTDGVPGLNVKFAEDSAWDKVIILSPQQRQRVMAEAKEKTGDIIDDIIVPSRTKGSAKSISGSVKLSDLGEGDPATWGYQVVVQSNEGFPAGTDLLTRKVNEYEGQHRFGGGNDGECDPHVIDLLAGDADGSADETEAQHTMLAYTCDDEGMAKKYATLTMIRK